MNDVQSGGSSEIDVAKVIRGQQPPPDLFDPKHLPEVADNPFWKSVAQSAMGVGGDKGNMASAEN